MDLCVCVDVSDEKDCSLTVPKRARQVKIYPNPKPQKLPSAF